jgi:hypothetical protein
MGVQTDLRAGWCRCDRCGTTFEFELELEFHLCL